MILVEKYQDVRSGISFVKNFKKKIITNFFLDEVKIQNWIEERIFFKIEVGESLFFVLKNKGFYSLFFITSSTNELQLSLSSLLSENPDIIFVSDLVLKDESSEIITIFEQNSFNKYTSLVRMSKMVSNTNVEFVNNINLKEACVDQLDEIYGLFNKYFDPLAEQLPNKSDLLSWVKKGNLLIYEENNEIQGFLIYNLNGVTLYLRYWFVMPAYREKKIGSLLFNYFLYKGKDTKRQLFWVIRSNENAIKRYKHYGFKKEKMYNFVMVNKNMKYEN